MNTKKKQRRPPQRFNPLGNPEVYDEEVKLQDFKKEKEDSTIIINKLKSFDPKLREMATISLAQITHFTEDFMKQLNDQGAIKLLIQRLVDPNPLIIVNSLMALTNMVESDIVLKQKSIGDIIISNGVIILLETLLSNFKEAHQQRQINPQNQDFGIKILILDQSYKLLSNLAEVVDEVSLNLLLQSQATSIGLYFILNCDESRILTGIGSYLQVLTETSLKLCQEINSNVDFLRRLVIIAESNFSSQEVKAYMLGSIFNYVYMLERNGIEPAGKNELCEKVIQGLVNILGIHIFEEIENLVKIYEDNKKKVILEQEQKKQKAATNLNKEKDAEMVLDVGHNNHLDKAMEETKTNEKVQKESPVHDVRLKQALNIWNDSAVAIKICLGVIINMFESEDKYDDEWQDENDNEENDEQQNPKLNKYEPPKTSFMNIMTHKVRIKILESVIDKCQHLPENILYDFLSDLNIVSDQSKLIIEAAFPCIMNILLNIEYSDRVNNNQSLNEIAEQLFKLCINEWTYYLEVIYANSQGNLEDSDEKEDISFQQNVLKDIVKILIELLQASGVNLAPLMDVAELLKVQVKTFDLLSEESKLAAIELIGTRCHPKFGLKIEENELVGEFLFELLKSENVMIIGEALNAIFDVYSEESYDEVFLKKGFIEVLTFGYNVFKKKISENKESLSPENYALLRNHLLNLRRFIKYKQEHIGK